jgi:hydrogenase small subunit
MKFCSTMAGTLALPSSFSSKISSALQTAPRTPVIWLEFQDCAGCTESFLRASRPSVAELVLDVLSVDYHETIMAAAGHQAEAAKKASIDAGGYLLLVEGSIPTAENGIHCTIGGRTAVDILEEAASNAAAVVAIGSCATYGGWPKASPNPTGAVAVKDLVTDKPVVNLAGCSVNAINITATVVHFLTFGELPAMDGEGRPLFAYGHLIHDNCERRGHFDAGEFVRAWGDEGHRLGWCLYEMGCKGPETYTNCPAVGWNETEKWPIAGGHGCIGCTEIDFWEWGVYNLSDIQRATPPVSFAPAQLPQEHIDPANAALIGGAAGVVLGVAGAAAYNQLSKKDGQEEDGTASSAEED